MLYAARKMLAHLPADKVLRLTAHLKALEQWPRNLNIGTGCSGTDVIMHSLDVLNSTWQSAYNTPIGIHHVWSCEKDKFKQDFILAHWQPMTLYNDMDDLRSGGGVDVCSGMYKEVAPADIFICGIECDSISSLNVNASKQRACAQTGTDKTGSTMKHAMAYVDRHRPFVCIFEITKSVYCKPKDGSDSVYECIVKDMNSFGFIVHSQVLSADSFGSPQRRDRAWIMCFKVQLQPLNPNQNAKDFPLPKWAAEIQGDLRAMQIPMLPIERFLLCDSEVREIMANDPWFQVSCEKASKAAKTTSKPAEFEVNHLDAFAAAGLPWPPAWDDEPEFAARVACYPKRAREVIYYYSRLPRSEEDAMKETCHDINMNLAWHTEAEEKCVCITCSSILYLRRRQREILGTELLAIQGFSFEAQNNNKPGCSAATFSHRKKVELAGNAFNGFVGMAALISVIVAYPWPADVATLSAAAKDGSEDDVDDGSSEHLANDLGEEDLSSED